MKRNKLQKAPPLIRFKMIMEILEINIRNFNRIILDLRSSRTGNTIYEK